MKFFKRIHRKKKEEFWCQTVGEVKSIEFLTINKQNFWILQVECAGNILNAKVTGSLDCLVGDIVSIDVKYIGEKIQSECKFRGVVDD